MKKISAVQKNSGFFNGSTNLFTNVKNRIKSYKDNIQHTYEHKIYFSIIEKELFGSNSIDSLTHDADKMLMYVIGMPKNLVYKIHRAHSSHHIESGKKPNLKSMLCDNIASCPEFKPEKKYHLREYYESSKELQSVPGFQEILEKYNFGEDLDFNKIKKMKNLKYNGSKGFTNIAAGFLSLLLHI